MPLHFSGSAAVAVRANFFLRLCIRVYNRTCVYIHTSVIAAVAAVD